MNKYLCGCAPNLLHNRTPAYYLLLIYYCLDYL